MGYLGTLLLSSVASSFLFSLLVLATYFFTLNPGFGHLLLQLEKVDDSLLFHSYLPIYHAPFLYFELVKLSHTSGPLH